MKELSLLAANSRDLKEIEKKLNLVHPNTNTAGISITAKQGFFYGVGSDFLGCVALFRGRARLRTAKLSVERQFDEPCSRAAWLLA